MPRRKACRLRTFDYSTPGAYYVTICAYRGEEIFGRSVDDELRQTAVGLEVARCWAEIPAHFPTGALDAFVLMPNHVHGILLLADGTVRLPNVVGSFKSAASREINVMRGDAGGRVWQRGYYEHVVRSEEELEAIRRYVLDNPAAWNTDPENSARMAMHVSAPWL